MDVIASYPDFTFYKNPNYTIRLGNQTIVLNEHFGLPEEKVKQTISQYSSEKDFLKDFMSYPKLIKGDKVILGALEEAKDPDSARTGLLGRSSILRGHGLLIHNCNSIHMFGMEFPINVYFLDRGMQVVAKFEGIPVESYTPYIHDACYALETAVVSYDINIGDRLDILKFEFTELQ